MHVRKSSLISRRLNRSNLPGQPEQDINSSFGQMHWGRVFEQMANHHKAMVLHELLLAHGGTSQQVVNDTQ